MYDCIISRWFNQSVVHYSDVHYSCIRLYTIVCLEHLHNFFLNCFFPEGQGGMKETFENSGGE